jgi:hypothetical protein
MDALTRFKKQMFDSVCKKFHEAVQISPTKATLNISKAINAGFNDYRDFVGENEIEAKSYTLNCLYSRNVTDKTRTKYGLETDVSAVLYLSPKELRQVVGRWDLKEQEVSVSLLGVSYLCYKVYFEGLTPEFGSCVSVTLALTNIK